MPKTIPRGRPLRNRQATCSGEGATANRTRAASAIAISTRIAAARRSGVISATTRMPISFDSV